MTESVQLSHSFTRPTLARRVKSRTLDNERILECERMTTLALGFPSVLCGHTVPSEVVHAGRDGFHVVRTHASTVPAQVVDLETFGNRTIREFVGEPMRKHRSTSSALTEHGIPVGHLVAAPVPARLSLFHQSPEPIFGRSSTQPHGRRGAMQSKGLVMLRAEPTCEIRLVAITNSAGLGGHDGNIGVLEDMRKVFH